MGQRIRTAREEIGLSAEEFAHRLGRASRKWTWEIETGKKVLDVTDLAQVARLLGRPITWLLTGALEEPAQQPRPIRTVVRELLARYETLEFAEVPVLGAMPSEKELAEEQGAEDWLQVPRHLIGEARRPFALKIEGESLAGLGIHEGDSVVVDPDAPLAEAKVYAVRIGSEVTAKRLYREGSRLRLVGPGGAYEVLAAHRVQTLGRVILAGHWEQL